MTKMKAAVIYGEKDLRKVLKLFQLGTKWPLNQCYIVRNVNFAVLVNIIYAKCLTLVWQVTEVLPNIL